MAVANETIIQKMMQELTKAKDVSNNQERLLTHIEHVRLLCDLLLEEKNEGYDNAMTKTNRTKITADEMKAMMGTTKKVVTPPSERTNINHGEANGDSIFDF